MRKVLIISLVVLLSLVLANGFVDAKITGVCSNCHTMHNSQNGSPVAGGGPYEYLLKLGATAKTACWGCHAESTTGGNNISPTTGAPQVAHNTTDLAGGNFSYITGDKALTTGTTKTVGHNVKDTAVTDDNYTSGTFPPGDQHTTGITNANFTCAGQYGCHGDRTASSEYPAVYGAHHYLDNQLKFGSINEANQALGSGTNGEQVGSSYRFLKGVAGGEDSDWQATKSETDHNEYKGGTTMGTSTKTAPATGGTPSKGTISGLCAECHGFFHGTATNETGGTATPWKRHPTDIVLPNSSEYQSYYDKNTTATKKYSVEAPVARQSIPNAMEDDVTPATDVVMCLSCHTVHASPYEDILRWNYSGMDAGTTGASAQTGCFVCHTGKDGV
jgi:hypothetical protein